MRKRASRPARFAAIDNGAIDSLPSTLAVGLLTRLIRARDGDDVTVASIASCGTEGDAALSKAMRMLVEQAFVVKFKIQRAATQTFTAEDGATVVKRGGSWYTTFSVDSIPFNRDDVAVMVAEIYAGGNVKALRVEPVHLDPRTEVDRPTSQNAGVGPTCGNTGSDPSGADYDPSGAMPRPTPQQPGVGRPAPGRRRAHTETGFKDEGKTAHSARSAPDAGGNTSGSRDPGAGGSAASGKKSHRKSQPNPVQWRSVNEVIGYFPQEVAPPRAPELVQAILAALAEGQMDARTPAQLGERIRSRWIDHGYAQQHADGKIRSVVGVSIDMVRAYKRGDRYGCPDPRCESGADIDTGETCRACEVRIADRRVAKRQDLDQASVGGPNALPGNPTPCPVPTQRPAALSMTECSGRDGICGRPVRNGELCSRCKDDPEYAGAAGLEYAAAGPSPF